MDRLAVADWGLRSAGFTELAHYNDGRPIVVMRFEPEVGEAQRQMWAELCALWSELPVHPNLLEAVDHEGGKLSLRYAALDWKYVPSRDLGEDQIEVCVASWGIQLCAAFEAIAVEVPATVISRFMNPFVHVDVDRNARVGFGPLPSDGTQLHVKLAPELRPLWPHVGRGAFVYLVGRLLAELLPVSPQGRSLRSIIATCTHEKPHRRISTLDELRRVLIQIGGSVVAVYDRRGTAQRNLIEEGLGWLALRDREAALGCFEHALAADPRSQLATAGWLAALGDDERLRRTVSGEIAHRVAASKPHPPRAWSDVQPAGAEREAEHAFGDALRLYGVAYANPETDAARFTAIARCHLHLHDASPAASAAQRALVLDPDHLEARSIHARALLLGYHPLEALAAIDALLARTPDDAMAHYTRGKALFALRRLVEARDSFDRACQLRPAMLEAMLLRRETDRALGGVRRTVGEQPPMIDLPAHLAELHGALAAGRIAEVITALEPHADGAARLIRARLLLLENRLDEALACYASIDAPEHRRDALVGQATVLLELDRVSATRSGEAGVCDRAAEALARFELLLRDAPDDLDLADGRARALAQLGRGAEAEPVFSQPETRAER